MKHLIFSIIFLLALLLISQSPANVWASPTVPKIKTDSAFKPSEIKEEKVGDLKLNIPLLQVPGKNGFTFPLLAYYSSGIKMDQEAGSIGLGWQFEIGSVTKESSKLGNGELEVSYYLNLDGERYPLGKVSQDKKISTKAGYITAHSSRKEYFDYFTLTKPDGTQYVFGSKLGDKDTPPWNGVHVNFFQMDERIEENGPQYCNVRPCTKFYNTAWELTEVISPKENEFAKFTYFDYTDPKECYIGQREGCAYYLPHDQNWNDAAEHFLRPGNPRIRLRSAR